jgi:hypothetical protein
MTRQEADAAIRLHKTIARFRHLNIAGLHVLLALQEMIAEREREEREPSQCKRVTKLSKCATFRGQPCA